MSEGKSVYRPADTPRSLHSEPKGVNAPEDMQLSTYGQRSLVPSGTISESLIEATYTLRGPKDDSPGSQGFANGEKGDLGERAGKR